MQQKGRRFSYSFKEDANESDSLQSELLKKENTCPSWDSNPGPSEYYIVRHSYQLSHWDSGIGVEDIWHIYP